MIKCSEWLWSLAKLLYAASWRFVDHEQGVIAGHIAYSFMLSVLPFLVFATALTGYLVGPEGTEAALETMFRILPMHVAQTLEPVVEDVTSQPRRDVLTVAAFGAVWAASNGVEAVRVGFNRAYEYDIERHFAISRLLSLVMVFAGFVTFMLFAALIIIAPLVLQLLDRYTEFVMPESADLVRYGGAAFSVTLFILMLHRILPARRMGGFTLWPGILASVVLWLAAATALTMYLSNVTYYSVTYGTLAGVIITLLFLYLMGAALVFGAEINAIVNRTLLAPPDLSRDALIEMQKRIENRRGG